MSSTSSKNRILRITGDVNPFEYGGGVVFSNSSHGDVQWEFWDIDGDATDSTTIDVYRVTVPEDVIAQYDDRFVVAIAGFVDQSPKQIRDLAHSKEIEERFLVLESLVAHYGGYELDQYPVKLTVKELRARWGRGLTSFHKRARREHATGAFREQFPAVTDVGNSVAEMCGLVAERKRPAHKAKAPTAGASFAPGVHLVSGAAGRAANLRTPPAAPARPSKPAHKPKLTKAQRRGIAMQNLAKAHARLAAKKGAAIAARVMGPLSAPAKPRKAKAAKASKAKPAKPRKAAKQPMTPERRREIALQNLAKARAALPAKPAKASKAKPAKASKAKPAKASKAKLTKAQRRAISMQNLAKARAARAAA